MKLGQMYVAVRGECFAFITELSYGADHGSPEAVKYKIFRDDKLVGSGQSGAIAFLSEYILFREAL